MAGSGEYSSSKKQKVGAIYSGVAGSEYDTARKCKNINGQWCGWCFVQYASVFMVNANRNDDRWNVNLNRFNARNEWNAENRFFSPRNYLFSPAILCGSFSSQERRHRYDIRPTS